MQRATAIIRLCVLIVVATVLGNLVERDPGHTTLGLPDKGIAVTVPANLEGWRLTPGQGEVLVTGQTRLGLVSLEIAEVQVFAKTDIPAVVQQRHALFRKGKQEYTVWYEGDDYRFGQRYAPTYKATYRDRLPGLPLTAEFWQYDVYWAYKDHFVRIGMRYPDLMSRYVEPDKILIAAGLWLAGQGDRP